MLYAFYPAALLIRWAISLATSSGSPLSISALRFDEGMNTSPV